MDYSTDINGYTLEFFEENHVYLIDGIKMPGITQILAHRFGGKYRFVKRDVLKRAADKGTAVHNAIELYCRTGVESDIPELRGFKFLQRQFGFEVMENETPVVLFWHDEPIAAGRLDLVIRMGVKVGGADIKRTSTLDKNYLAAQLNLYRIAYRQTYGIEWEFLRGIHLRENVRKFVEIPINEESANELIKEYLGGKR